MVSRATKRIWKSVALGLALGPVIGAASVAPAQTGNPPATATASGMPGPAPANDMEACRQLVRQGRAALQAGDKVTAEKLARQAAAMKVSMPYWETDSPEKLLLDIGVKNVPPPARAMRADPHLLVKQGQDALKAGRIDDAQKLAQQAKLITSAKWSLFEETPDKLLDEVQKARAVREKAEADKALAAGRRLYDQGKYDDAEKLAYKAAKLHGPYGVWDFGDKPEKLIADCRTAREKARKTTVPAPTGTAVTSKSTSPAKPITPATTVKQTSATAPPPNWPSEIKTADVRGGPDLGPAVTTAAVVAPAGAPTPIRPVAMQPVTLPEPTGAPMPLPMPVAAMPPAPMPMTMPGPVPAPPSMPVQPQMNPARMQAMQCMREGKDHQAAGRFIEARAKYKEAMRCGADFGPTDDTPDRCLMELSAAVVRQVEMALKDASPTAEVKLKQARALALDFALDTRAIDAQLGAMRGMAMQPTVPVANDPRSIGQNLLEKARLEIKRGQCETARQLATEVHNGPYGMREEAVAVLRTIEVEENNQRVLAANRNFDAGVAAFRNKEYLQATAIFQQIEPGLLSPDKKSMLADYVAKCSQPAAPVVAHAPPPSPITQVSAPPSPPSAVANAASKGVTGVGQMPQMTAPAAGDNLAAQVQAMQEIEYQKLREEGLDVQRRALDMWARGETDTSLETLSAYVKKVKASKLDAASIARLEKPIDAKIYTFTQMKASKDSLTRVASSKDNFLKARHEELDAEQKKQQQVKDLMKQYHALYKDGKYQEARLIAEKAQELDRDEPIITAAILTAKYHANLSEYDKNRLEREDYVVKELNDADHSGPPLTNNDPIRFDPVRMRIANDRTRDRDGIRVLRSQSAKDLEIEKSLNRPVEVNFHNVTLRQAVEDLRAMTKMNIHIETEALAAEAINPETQVSLQGNLMLKNALKVLLGQAHLTYIIQDEMLKITTPRGAQGKQVQKVYSVADLIIPIDDYILPETGNYDHMMKRIVEQQGQINLNGAGGTPMSNRANMLQNGQNVGGGSNTMSTTPGGETSLRTTGVQPGSLGSTMSNIASVSPTKQTMQDVLVKLITNTVAPGTWAEVGGSGTIDYMPIGMALVINQTPDVQEQVADLLDALRKLQDLEVAVEVRIITLAETFFERIGLDFALNITPTKNSQKYEPQLVTGQFAPPGQINSFMPQNFLTGITGIGQNTGSPGNFTSNLDIPIRSSSFQYAVPPFGYPNNPGFDGGLSLGLAFLSDIQVYMFMEAAQGDRRTNVMQAPKLTLFNGQTATINVNDQQFFVTNVNVVGFGGQIVFVPVNNPVPLGVQLAIQAVVSADRRFVRLNLAPTLTNLASATVPLFPVTTFITPVFEGGAQGQPIPFTQFIQQPDVASVQIQTTVSIPDGGTVILGGLKTLSEGRNEFGPPVLSKLPYIDRLFKNVGYGREAQSLLLMVTPRIIINSEEEEKQTGEVTSREPAVNR